jgi:hypothetical protein
MNSPFSFLKHRLAKEITVILLLKLTLLMGIKALWFDAPTIPKDGTVEMSQRLLSTTPASLKIEETPR